MLVYGNSGPGLVIKLWASAGKYKHSCLDTECNRYTVEMIEINIDEFSKIKKQKLIFYLFIFILFTFGMFH